MSGDDFWFSEIGIPWCREEDYNTLLSISEDAHDMPRTWKRFTELVEEVEQEWQTQGRTVRRVYINPYAFPDWCKSKGYRVNAHARHRFAFEAVTKTHRGE
ncbi:MAG: hypothetical protein ACREFD_09895 [Stellaceae bacterium]